MPWIRVVPFEEARGLLRKQYDDAVKRAGRVWGIVSVMSVNASTARASMALYTTVMHGKSPLSRKQREMLAVAVSAQNRCLY